MSNKPTEYVFELRVDLDVRSYGEAVDRVLDAMLAADIPASLHTARPAAPPADELEDRLTRLLEQLEEIAGGDYGVSKADQCEHGQYGYEDCESCVIEAMQKATQEARGE